MRSAKTHQSKRLSIQISAMTLHVASSSKRFFFLPSLHAPSPPPPPPPPPHTHTPSFRRKVRDLIFGFYHSVVPYFHNSTLGKEGVSCVRSFSKSFCPTDLKLCRYLEQLLLQYLTDGLETSYMIRSLSENLHVMLIFSFDFLISYFRSFRLISFLEEFLLLSIWGSYLVCVTPPRFFHWSNRNFADGFGMVWIWACLRARASILEHRAPLKPVLEDYRTQTEEISPVLVCTIDNMSCESFL